MKALYLDHLTKYGLTERPMPTIRSNEVLIKVEYAAICHTDVIIRGGFAPHGIESFIPGHEFVGTVVACGAEAEHIPIGSRGVVQQIVTCHNCGPCILGHEHACEHFYELGVGGDGGFAEYCAVPSSNFHILPDDIDLLDAVLTEPLSNAVSAVYRAKPLQTDRVVVVGCGAIGILCAQVAALFSPKKLVLVGTRDERLEIGRQACPGVELVNIRSEGAEEQLKTQLLEGKGADVVIECSGTKSGVEMAMDLMADYGRVCFEGTLDRSNPVPFTTYSLKVNGTFYGISGWTQQDFFRAFSLIIDKKIITRPLVTHIFPLEKWEEAFEMATIRKSESMRVLLKP